MTENGLAAEARMDLALAVPAALEAHPAVSSVRLAGSRAEDRAHEVSDWDFAVATADFQTVARDLSALVAALRPLAEQWDPYTSHECYMLILLGPTKVDLLFLDEPREWSPPWKPSPASVDAIDRHFWDWILWLEQKRSAGREDVVVANLRTMHDLLLGPMGVAAKPASISVALDEYLAARGRMEELFGVRVSRTLEREVRPFVARRQTAARASGARARP